MLRFDRVSFSYSQESETSPVIGEVSFSLAKEEALLVLGRNGSGKTTLGLLIAGLLAPSSGTITVGDSTRGFRPRVGMLFQSSRLPMVGETVEEEIAFGLENLELPKSEILTRLEDVIRAFRLEGVRTRPPETLSGGWQQKVALAGVLAMRPDILVLDEPTARLDPWDRRDFGDIMAKINGMYKPVIVYLSQLLPETNLIPRILVLSRGKLVFDGSPGTFQAHPGLLEWGLAVSGP